MENWKASVNRKRAELAALLHQPLANLAALCPAAWGDRQRLDELLRSHFASVPFVKYLYALDAAGQQVCDNIAADRIVASYFGRDRSQRPYFQEPMPPWGFLLSDAYVSLTGRPSLTALHVIRDGDRLLGYLGADFDLRNLPVEPAVVHEEPRGWRQIKGDPSIRGTVFLQQRSESPMDSCVSTAVRLNRE